MPAKTILTLLFLISLGAAVIVCLHALPQRLNPDTATAKEEILVATAALPSGTLLRAKDVVWRTNAGKADPSQIVRPPGVAGNGSADLDQQASGEVYGAALRSDISAGDPIRRSAIVKPGDRDFLQVVLSPGERAIAIPVATGGAGTGLLYPGDRVDVILTQTFKNDPPPAHRSVSETVVESLRVLAVDAPDAKAAGAGNGFGRTVTLEVTHRAGGADQCSDRTRQAVAGAAQFEHRRRRPCRETWAGRDGQRQADLGWRCLASARGCHNTAQGDRRRTAGRRGHSRNQIGSSQTPVMSDRHSRIGR